MEITEGSDCMGESKMENFLLVAVCAHPDSIIREGMFMLALGITGNHDSTGDHHILDGKGLQHMRLIGVQGGQGHLAAPPTLATAHPQVLRSHPNEVRGGENHRNGTLNLEQQSIVSTGCLNAKLP